MPTIHCKACWAEVDSKTRTCPYCGQNLPRRIAWVLLGSVVVVGAIVAVVGTVMRFVAPDPIQQAAGAAESKRHSAAVAAAEAIRGKADPPESLRFQFLGVDDSAQVVCAKYSARNESGQTVREAMIFEGGKSSEATEDDWTAKCVGLRSYLWAVM